MQKAITDNIIEKEKLIHNSNNNKPIRYETQYLCEIHMKKYNQTFFKVVQRDLE